ncbi:hypothetical protein ACN27F_18330 [Solwaraspora sp. WMMB335]|uniref:hypothetical protein n=1 Tax=Solwaraspora sp. WMMB335 TaxID=3404118 RepID=UPI003B95E432
MQATDERAGRQGRLALVSAIATVIGAAAGVAQWLTSIGAWAVVVLGLVGLAATSWSLSKVWRDRQAVFATLLALLLVVIAGVTGAAIDRIISPNRPLPDSADPSPTGQDSPSLSTSLPGTGRPAPTVPANSTAPSSQIPTGEPSVIVYDWKERWSDPIQLRFPGGIDFDYLPPPGRAGFGGDLDTSRDGSDMRTHNSGKLLEWGNEGEPSPQQCYELTARSPAGQDSQYINNPQVGSWYCLLTWNDSLPGRIVVFRVTEVVEGGFNLQATVWNRNGV